MGGENLDTERWRNVCSTGCGLVIYPRNITVGYNASECFRCY